RADRRPGTASRTSWGKRRGPWPTATETEGCSARKTLSGWRSRPASTSPTVRAGQPETRSYTRRRRVPPSRTAPTRPRGGGANRSKAIKVNLPMKYYHVAALATNHADHHTDVPTKTKTTAADRSRLIAGAHAAPDRALDPGEAAR